MQREWPKKWQKEKKKKKKKKKKVFIEEAELELCRINKKFFSQEKKGLKGILVRRGWSLRSKAREKQHGIGRRRRKAGCHLWGSREPHGRLEE